MASPPLSGPGFSLRGFPSPQGVKTQGCDRLSGTVSQGRQWVLPSGGGGPGRKVSFGDAPGSGGVGKSLRFPFLTGGKTPDSLCEFIPTGVSGTAGRTGNGTRAVSGQGYKDPQMNAFALAAVSLAVCLAGAGGASQSLTRGPVEVKLCICFSFRSSFSSFGSASFWPDRSAFNPALSRSLSSRNPFALPLLFSCSPR